MEELRKGATSAVERTGKTEFVHAHLFGEACKEECERYDPQQVAPDSP